jgi:5,10-methylene-tetrahydrofolate dehydrogenase/methenyl tetrahydrofolate cyclohydrolase
MFAAVVKEADVVVLCFERLDLALDEVIEHNEIIFDGLGDIE